MNRGGSKLRDNEPRDTSAAIAKKARAARPFTVSHFKEWASHLILDSGEPWTVEPFQAQFVNELFRGYIENWLIVPEGNAKTTLMAGFVLYHALFKPSAQVVVAASSRDQAEWLFRAAQGFVDRSGLGPKNQRAKHESRLEEPDTFTCYAGLREIRINNSRIKVFAADDRTGDGAIFTLAVLEELHRHRDLRLYRTWRGKAEKRGGQVIAISTAGEPDGEFEQVRKKIRDAAPEVTRKGSFIRATSPTTVLHEWAVPDDKDPDDVREVWKANPLKAITVAQLQRKHDSPSMTHAHWRRFVCGLPARLEAWIEPQMWDGLKQDVGNITEGDEIYVALRVGAGAGIAVASPRAGAVAVAGKVYPPPPNARISLEYLEGELLRLASRYQMRAVLFDSKQFRRSAEILQRAGLPMVEAPQSATRLAQATATLWRLISAGLLGHDGDPELRTQVLAGQTKDTEEGYRLVPDERTHVLIALAMAVHEASALMEKKVYVSF